MPLDIELLQAAEELRVPVMGSETVAPLLYFLVRFTRPRKVLEVGTGYTTPFIARALADIIVIQTRDDGRRNDGQGLSQPLLLQSSTLRLTSRSSSQ